MPEAFRRKGVLMMLNLRPSLLVRLDHFDNIEPGRILQQSVRLEKGRGRTGHAAATEGIDGKRRSRSGFTAAGLHLDENDRATVDGDDVEFAVTQPAARGDDAVFAMAAKVASGVTLALLSEGEWAETFDEPLLYEHHPFPV